jgi:hypothetical protein
MSEIVSIKQKHFYIIASGGFMKAFFKEHDLTRIDNSCFRRKNVTQNFTCLNSNLLPTAIQEMYLNDVSLEKGVNHLSYISDLGEEMPVKDISIWDRSNSGVYIRQTYSSSQTLSVIFYS